MKRILNKEANARIRNNGAHLDVPDSSVDNHSAEAKRSMDKIAEAIKEICNARATTDLAFFGSPQRRIEQCTWLKLILGRMCQTPEPCDNKGEDGIDAHFWAWWWKKTRENCKVSYADDGGDDSLNKQVGSASSNSRTRTNGMRHKWPASNEHWDIRDI